MKILLGSSLYSPHAVGGAEKVVEALALKLVALGHKVAILTTQPRGNRAHAQLRGVSVHYIPVKNLYRPFGNATPGPVRKALWRALDSYNWLMRSPIAEILDEERPDVVNTHNLFGFSVSLWSSAFERHIPLVHTLHDQYLLCHRGTMFKGGRNCTSRCVDCRVLGATRKRASRLVDVAIGVSQFILQRHTSHGYFPKASPAVIYNTGMESRAPLFAIRTLSTRPRFGFLGQIIPTKGLHLLIEAFRRLPDFDAELVIAGRGEPPYETILKSKSAADGRISWLGYVNPEDLFNRIDILVVPSVWNDTAPLVVLEAFRHGIPVIGSNLGGIPELIVPGTGLVYSTHDRTALDRALLGCVDSADTYAAMSAKCLDQARECFSMEWARSYVSVYDRAIERRRTRSAAA